MSTSPPIDIAAPASRLSNSPSNLTAQLQNPQQQQQHPQAMSAFNTDSTQRPDQARGRQESITPFGARSIPVREGARRESNGLGGSYMNGGMSWGNISMGSFIRDEYVSPPEDVEGDTDIASILMSGTSPLASFHYGSSWLPKMESNYMKDYVCCDIHLDSMHELLQHYEEAHAQQPNQTIGRTPQEQKFMQRPTNATTTAQAVQQQTQAEQGNMAPQQAQLPASNFPAAPSPLFTGNNQDQISTFDNLDDMEMDDGVIGHPQTPGNAFQPQPQFGRQQPRAPSLNVNLANAFQGHNFNTSTPTTPHASQQMYGVNPTVSSVNTPALSTQTVSQRIATPDSSTPGTPADLDIDASQLNNLGIDYQQLLQGNYDFSSLNLNQNAGSATIDDPAKRLLSKQGFTNKGFPASALNGDSELAKRVKETQLLNGLAGAGGFVTEEIKPFKCPVIGCEKAYKNMNGLKYHRQHGHQNQQLRENSDGTFSIVDPTTSIPYPGTLGMEKEKPYRCEVCGKRYKNLNGLKYHRQHSPPCNPELKLGAQGLAAMPTDVSGLNVNVAGAGLSGITMGY